jgi:hypothetical protein
MSEELVKFVLEGTSDRNGNIPADVFLAKLRQFVTTMYSFDRAFARRSKRAVELEVVDLRRVNPAIVAFKPRSQVVGYDAQASIQWTVAQFAKIHDGEGADIAIPQEALDNIVDLARLREQKMPPLQGIRVEYAGLVVSFDSKMEGNALVLRSERHLDTAEIWRAGVSKGSVFGELRGVMDINGERQFYISPPTGSAPVQCIFPEELRDQMNGYLFKVVRVFGFLRYDGKKPSPYLVEAERIEGHFDGAASSHFLSLLGAFKDYEMPEPSEFA